MKLTTTDKIALIILILLGIILVADVTKNYINYANNKQQKIVTPPTYPSAFTLLTEEAITASKTQFLYTVKDKQTGQEYILYLGSNGCAITPRLQGK